LSHLELFSRTRDRAPKGRSVKPHFPHSLIISQIGG
jgi:hypothetical protein